MWVLKRDKVSACWQKGWRRRRGPRSQTGTYMMSREGGQVERSQLCDNILVPGCRESKAKCFRLWGDLTCWQALQISCNWGTITLLVTHCAGQPRHGVTARLQSPTGAQGDSCGRPFLLRGDHSCSAPVSVLTQPNISEAFFNYDCCLFQQKKIVHFALDLAFFFFSLTIYGPTMNWQLAESNPVVGFGSKWPQWPYLGLSGLR